MTKRSWIAAAACFAGAALGARDAGAFCGFYVSGADSKLFNDATQVVLMREGMRTVLSMQNTYQGPPEDFAMVIPVPVVLQKENVKTLAREVFDRVDQLTAPRLVEYWEQDPCPPPAPAVMADGHGGGYGRMAGAPAPSMAMKRESVRIEAQFVVGEYEIVVLSADDSMGLDTWLRANHYKIPDGAEPYLRPYVAMGMKFFVAKVDATKVKFERIGNGPEKAMLSPLRFHFDSERFYLPIRLGLINSGGTQDLIVDVLARGQRYEVSNYDNVAIPTNIDVAENAKDRFRDFYATLFDDTVAKHPRAVVTEYSWAAQSCDPCPTPPLQPADVMILGGDVLPGAEGVPAPQRMWRMGSGFVLTRLHARYSKDALGDDLFFRAAPPIVGGREFMQEDGKLERGARPDAMNNFQARYVIRHPWKGPIACANPMRGRWGGPPAGGAPEVKPAEKVALAPRSAPVSLAAFVPGGLPPGSALSSGDPTPVFSLPGAPSALPPVATSAPAPASSAAPAPPPVAPAESGCSGCAVGSTGGGALASIAAAIALAGSIARRIRNGRRRG